MKQTLREGLNFLSKNVVNILILVMSISCVLLFVKKNKNDKTKAEDLFELYMKANENEELKGGKEEGQDGASMQKAFLDEKSKTLKLSKIVKLTNTVKIFIFSYPWEYTHFGLGICKHIKFNGPNQQGKIKGKWNDREDREKDAKEIYRSYTPIYVDRKKKEVHFVIRIYSPDEHFVDGGKMSVQLEKMRNNQTVKIAGPFGVLDYKGSNKFSYLTKAVQIKRHIVMIAGGTGMTPFFRLIKHMLLFDAREGEQPFVTLIYANRNEEEILLKGVFDEYERTFERFKAVYSVDECLDPTKRDTFENVGYLTEDLLRKYILKYERLGIQVDSSDTLILMCGPPPMTAFLKKILKEDIQMENVITL
ncbi:oxidoreductase NAD-binding domain-containing protein [Plasmodium vivax India VII]|uniref:Oxidoreductase NAD-binding domain containing protein n=4 Tax=Plasmodium vivax TaxID=5855 RepID=A5K2T0_PLAVS|nr:oxidoreductase NAD-binding domain containing protein [Plasmodium vivax]KMZ79602.1 oxidoreductase NAD-binding domain-containing protein [Plasmodium vivax India VII]KMZ92352.1 oxidoreductase NAD-binding domain-containing protein [Plasmodium vivax Mauritania I]EDL46730.1 oxidoreductase NAD-binding domain containing protein [Plasmodium vivax]CAI7721182.1 NADH-cytochrome b5 reductase, putative [Plasmodium vivax]SCO67948.1 NADH-cytochrome b5 reductase, putative [Plasmodium vivax]|eukprot:XP_001616457.1 oxidoreductase NAD-binding domain containing protein [Plasmodium vivax Sal-1]